MIALTKLNGHVIYLNPHLIEQMEESKETRIQSVSGKIFIIRETVEQVIERIIKYRKKLGYNSQED